MRIIMGYSSPTPLRMATGRSIHALFLLIKGCIKRQRTLALRAAGEESIALRRRVRTQHELIRMTSAEWARGAF